LSALAFAFVALAGQATPCCLSRNISVDYLDHVGKLGDRAAHFGRVFQFHLTLHHDGNGRFGAGKVTLRSAPAGTGIIAGGPMRAVFESLGVADVVTKSVGTSNPYNMIRATFDALQDQTSPKSVAQRRGKKIADLLGRGSAGEAEAQAEAALVTE
jgi:hypothetical protein